VFVSNNLCLPPVGVIVLEDEENVSVLERQAGLLAGDEPVVHRVVREMRLQEHLYRKEMVRLSNVKKSLKDVVKTHKNTGFQILVKRS